MIERSAMMADKGIFDTACRPRSGTCRAATGSCARSASAGVNRATRNTAEAAAALAATTLMTVAKATDQGSKRASSVRTITDILVERRPSETVEHLLVEVEADGFLYNMVRNIVGTLVEVGRGKKPVDWVSEVLDAKDRAQAGMTAPPQGLFLVRVEYGD